MKLYSDLASYYYFIESKHRNILHDISLVKSLASGIKNASILDLGCGSGEHLSILSKEGFRCVGLDSSPEMLQVAKERNGQNIKYVLGDFRNFDFYEEFDVIVSFFGSLDYLLDDKDIDASLWNIYRALKSGGEAVIEIWNALPLIRIGEKKLGPVSTTYHNGAKIKRERGFKLVNSTKGTIVDVYYRYHFLKDGGIELVDDLHRMRAFKEAEFKRHLENNGFTIINIYSTPLKDKYRDYSNKMIFHFTKI